MRGGREHPIEHGHRRERKRERKKEGKHKGGMDAIEGDLMRRDIEADKRSEWLGAGRKTEGIREWGISTDANIYDWELAILEI